jgi:lipocalin
MGTSSSVPKLRAMEKVIDVDRFTGLWYVIACTTTPLDKNCVCATEHYAWRKGGGKAKGQLDVKYQWKTAPGKPSKTMYQDARVQDMAKGAEWRIRPRIFGGNVPLPIWLPYLIIEGTEEVMVVGYPDRAYLWIMSRAPVMAPEAYAALETRCVEEWGYGRDFMEKIHKVPQEWPKEGAAGAGGAGAGAEEVVDGDGNKD